MDSEVGGSHDTGSAGSESGPVVGVTQTWGVLLPHMYGEACCVATCGLETTQLDACQKACPLCFTRCDAMRLCYFILLFAANKGVDATMPMA